MVTRAADQAESLCRALEERGAVALRCPTIRIEPPEQWEPLDSALRDLEGFDWVVLTSPNGVRFTLDRMDEIGQGPAALAAARVAVVGTRTAEALRARGVEAALVGPDGGWAALAEALPPLEDARVLLARSDRADPEAPEVLRRRGAREVHEVVAYRTRPVPPSGAALDALRRGFDAITFTSPSTVHGLVALGPEWRGLLAGAIVATLGATTTGAAREAGLTVEEADETSMEALIGALERGFERRTLGSSGRRASGR